MCLNRIPQSASISMLGWALFIALILSPHLVAGQQANDDRCRGSQDPITIYKDGFGMGWVSGSRGTILDAYSTLSVRDGTTVSLSSFTDPFAEVSFKSSVPFCKDTILDIWVQGNLLNRASVLLMSSRYDSVSEPVPLWVAEPEMILTSSVLFQGKLRIQGPDSQNWFRVSVNLLDIANDDLSPPSWDTIVFRDDSGRGLSMYLSQAFILPNVDGNSPKGKRSDCIGSLCNPILGETFPTLSSDMVPLFGYTPLTTSVAQDVARGILDEDTLVVNAKLRSYQRNSTNFNSVKNWELIKFCGWIQGVQENEELLPTPPLFDPKMFDETVEELLKGTVGDQALGKCFLSDRDIYAASQNPRGNVNWPVLSIRAYSYDNLTAIRKMGLNKMDWMDKNEFATASQNTDIMGYSATALKESQACAGVPWGLSRIDQEGLPVDKQFSVPYNGSGVHVYVLDTGVSTHSDFGDRLGVGVNCVSGTCRLGDVSDDSGHGTHVAATIGGRCYGVAKGVTINPVKVLGGPSSKGSYAGIISGIKYATEQANANGWPALINLSLGGPRSSSLDIAVRMAVSMNVTVVVASGNDYFVNACTTSPASSALAMTVAATDIHDLAASFSNIGPCVDIWAPGNDIASADYSNYDGYEILSGTSMAAPHVSGVAALLLQEDPEFSPAQISERIFDAAVLRNLAPNTTKRLLNVATMFS